MRSCPLQGRAVRLCAALAASVVATLCIPGLALAAEKAVSTDLAWGIPSSEFAPTGEAISDVGARWVRIEFRWNEAEPSSKGSYDPNIIARYDRAIDTARAAGAKVLVFVNGSPRWASGSRIPMMKPQNPADYADFMRYVATRYAGRVSAWEVWNEENTSRFWPSGPSPAAYVPLLKAAYPAVKAGDPSALVVFGGVSQNDYSYIEGAYAAGAKGYFDVMAVHPYPGPNAPEDVWYSNGRIGTMAFSGFKEVRSSMLARGDDKPIWLTEFGWSTTTTESWGVTQSQQADYLTRAYRLLENYPYVAIAYWYNLRNNFWDQDADTWETQCGLMRTDFTHKPSYAAFRSYEPGAAATGPAPPPPDPSSPPPDPSSPPPAGASLPAGSGASSGTATARRPTRTYIALSRGRLVRRSARAASSVHSRQLLISGRVTGASGGRVEVRLRRRDHHGRWKTLRPRRTTLGGRGTFRLELGLQRAHWLAVRAVYEGSESAAPSRSRALRVRS
jgi:Cellulase (glycosyl hydrolase family 5)